LFVYPIKHENLSNGLVCRRSEELKKCCKHSKVFDVFRVYGAQKPCGIQPKILVVGLRVRDIITFCFSNLVTIGLSV